MSQRRLLSWSCQAAADRSVRVEGMPRLSGDEDVGQRIVAFVVGVTQLQELIDYVAQ
jgi:hypothetical protein